MSHHGEHNLSACKFLFSSDKIKYNDWVVTTAFYSALHYLDVKLFPFDYNGKTLKSIDEARKYLAQHNKHQTRTLLVQKKFPEIAHQFKWLSSNCHNARYVDYRVTLENAAYAKGCAVAIKEFLQNL
jgi:phosphatidylinositol kinase/protein kinase (PI-3  family)